MRDGSVRVLATKPQNSDAVVWANVTRLKGVFFLALLALTLTASTAQTSSAIAPVRDIYGHRLNLIDQDARATVFFFITNDCPITNRYIPEMNRIVADYEARKVAFYALYTDPTVSLPAIRRHALEYGLHMPLIADTEHSFVHRVGATVTPEVAVLNRGGKLAYLGRIDDLYVDLGERHAAPTHRYLRDALDDVLQGKPVASARIDPVGCSIYPD